MIRFHSLVHIQLRYCVLIFTHFFEERDEVDLLQCLASGLLQYDANPDHVIFTIYYKRAGGFERIGKGKHKSAVIESWSNCLMISSDNPHKAPETLLPDMCSRYSKILKEAQSHARISTEPTIQGATTNVAERSTMKHGDMQVFVTGALNLVGGALNLLLP